MLFDFVFKNAHAGFFDSDSGTLGDIVVSDLDTGETITATLTLADPTYGALTTSGSATYTAGTGIWTITDSVANVNTSLAAVAFVPTTNNDLGQLVPPAGRARAALSRPR